MNVTVFPVFCDVFAIALFCSFHFLIHFLIQFMTPNKIYLQYFATLVEIHTSSGIVLLADT